VGCLKIQAEIKPVEPDAGNAAEGKNSTHTSVKIIAPHLGFC